jgi:hypothetical protein
MTSREFREGRSLTYVRKALQAETTQVGMATQRTSCCALSLRYNRCPGAGRSWAFAPECTSLHSHGMQACWCTVRAGRGPTDLATPTNPARWM